MLRESAWLQAAQMRQAFQRQDPAREINKNSFAARQTDTRYLNVREDGRRLVVCGALALCGLGGRACPVMKRLVIVGASGMVGGQALRYALEHPDVDHVTSIGRRKLGISHSKLTEILHPDFANCSALAQTLMGQDGAIFCLGTYTGAVTDAELRTITVDSTVEFARVLRSGSPDAAFSFLSGNGADPTGQSRMPYARYKGEAEKALLAAGFPRVYIFRPAYIYPVEPRKEPTASYRLLRSIYPVFRVVFPNQVIRADDLARIMVDAAVGGTAGRVGPIFENRDIRAMVSALRPESVTAGRR